jgi:hypothetical protein
MIWFFAILYPDGQCMRKVTLNLPDDQVEWLQAQAKKEECTFTDLVRRAIHTERFFVEQEALGRTLLVEESPGGRLRHLLRR